MNQPSKFGYDSLTVDPPYQEFLVSSPKEVVAANDSSSLHRNVTVRKNKRNRKIYADIIKDKILEKKEDKQKTLVIECKKNDHKQESLDNTKSRKTKKDLRSKF